jgi:hypothetical protein
MSFVIDEKYVGRAVLRQDDPQFAVVVILAPVHFPVEISPHTAEQASQVWTFHIHVAAQFFTCETHFVLLFPVHVYKLKPTAAVRVNISFPSVNFLVNLLCKLEITSRLLIFFTDKLLTVQLAAFITDFLICLSAQSVNALFSTLRKTPETHGLTPFRFKTACNSSGVLTG